MAFEVQQEQLDQAGVGGNSGGARVGVTISNHSPSYGSPGVSPGSALVHLHQDIPATLNLFCSKLASSLIELDELSPLPSDWEKVLNLKTGDIHYRKKNYFGETSMSRNSKTPRLDLKLNLSPPRVNPIVDPPNRSASLSPTSPTSPQSSCVSSELSPDETLRYSNSPEATSMLLVGCPRCLMYVMLSEKEPKCPKCKSTVLLDFLHDTNITNKKSRRN